MGQDPLETINKLTGAINSGDLALAMSLYEPDAALVVQPGNVVLGREAIGAALQGFISLKPTLRSEVHKVVEAGDIVLYCSKWRLTGTSPDGQKVEMAGTSADVIRRQADGRWLVAIDNPWGTGIIG